MREVDVVLERVDGMISGIEIEASATVRARNFGGLKMLTDARGKRFAYGIVHYDGTDVIPFGEKLAAVPISSLWQ